VVTVCTASLTFYCFPFCPLRLYLCVPYRSQNKQRLFPYTASTSFCNSKSVCLLCVQYGWNNGPGSVPHQCMWDLWCTRLHWDRFFSSTQFSPVSISHQRSMFGWREGQTSEAWDRFVEQSESIGCTSKYMDVFRLKSYWGICRIMTYGGVEIWGVELNSSLGHLVSGGTRETQVVWHLQQSVDTVSRRITWHFNSLMNMM